MWKGLAGAFLPGYRRFATLTWGTRELGHRGGQRVPVKHSMGPRRGTNTFRIAVTTSAGPCTVKDADWLAIYLVSMDTLYLIPVRKLRRRNGTMVWHIQITPGGREPGQWDAYRERWDLLREAGKRKRRGKK